MEYRIGCSGWSYGHWRGNFYPKGVPQTRWLEHYAQSFDTVELNNTFYRYPTENAVDGWRRRVPDGFKFSVKVSRFITHYWRLTRVDERLDRFLALARRLGDRLGPLLYQLPSSFERDDDLLDAFLRQLPTDLNPVFEFRDDSWWTDSTFETLRRHEASFCIYNAGQTTTPIVATAPDAYVASTGRKEAPAIRTISWPAGRVGSASSRERSASGSTSTMTSEGTRLETLYA